MDQSPMGKLSPELRNMIYELVLGNIPVKISCEYWGKPPLTSGPRPKHLALTETCKQIQDESIPIFYGMNEFTFTVTPSAGSSAFNGRADLASPHALYRLRDLLGSIESKKLGMMKQVKLQIGFADPKVFYVEAEVLMQFAGFLRAAGTHTSVHFRFGSDFENLWLTWLDWCTSVEEIATADIDDLQKEWMQWYQIWATATASRRSIYHCICRYGGVPCRALLEEQLFKVRAEIKRNGEGLFE